MYNIDVTYHILLDGGDTCPKHHTKKIIINGTVPFHS